MTQKVLLDSSVYIEALRTGRRELWAARQHPVWIAYFSVVVGSELLRGARERRAVRLVEKLWQDFTQADRLVAPHTRDWHDAGDVLRRIGVKYGYERIGQSRLVHDVLIALSARRSGIAVVTLNVADFQRIAEFRPVRVLLPEQLTAQ
jgi:predicted nucleic acid-binding protein